MKKLLMLALLLICSLGCQTKTPTPNTSSRPPTHWQSSLKRLTAASDQVTLEDYEVIASAGIEAVPILNELVAGPDSEIAAMSVACAAHMKGEVGVSIIRKGLDRPEAHPLTAAVRAARGRKLNQLLPQLRTIASESQIASARADAIVALGALQDRLGQPVVMKGLRSQEPEIVEAAVLAAKDLNTPELKKAVDLLRSNNALADVVEQAWPTK